MKNKPNFFSFIKVSIEKYLPMSFGSFVLFLFVIYLIFVVSKSMVSNYNSNKSIRAEEEKVAELKDELKYLEFQINYYQTYSFKEKEAREKLGYRAPGENVVSLPVDTSEEKVADSELREVKIRVPNYRLWWSYFFEN